MLEFFTHHFLVIIESLFQIFTHHNFHFAFVSRFFVNLGGRSSTFLGEAPSNSLHRATDSGSQVQGGRIARALGHLAKE